MRERFRAAAAAELEVPEAFNHTEAAFPDAAVVQELIEARVARDPLRAAVRCDHDGAVDAASLSYGEINERANRLAHHLRASGVGRGDVVALMVERSYAMVIGIFGVLKAGAPYLPVSSV